MILFFVILFSLIMIKWHLNGYKIILQWKSSQLKIRNVGLRGYEAYIVYAKITKWFNPNGLNMFENEFIIVKGRANLFGLICIIYVCSCLFLLFSTKREGMWQQRVYLRTKTSKLNGFPEFSQYEFNRPYFNVPIFLNKSCTSLFLSLSNIWTIAKK